jgi:hypothetical protein
MEMMKRVFTFTQVVGINNVNTLVIALRSQTALYRFTQADVFGCEGSRNVIGTGLIDLAIDIE